MSAPQPLPTWERTHCKQDAGRPLLFYVVYGSFPGNLQISRTAYRCEGMPKGMGLQTFSRARHAETLEKFCQGYVWEQLKRENSTLAAAIENAPQCAIVRGEPVEYRDLNYLRNTVGLVTWFMDNGGHAVYDPLMLKWWMPHEWREQIFEPATPHLLHHTTVLVSREKSPDLVWLHTRGMRKFGRPDLSVRNVPPTYRKLAIDMLNRFMLLEAAGGVIEEGLEVKMMLLPPGLICHHKGNLQDPEFNNRYVEIAWP